MTARTSWADPRAGGSGSWTHTQLHDDRSPIALLIAVVLCLLGAVLFIGLVTAGRAAMCATHQTADGHGALSYCSDFDPTSTTTEPTK